MKDIILKHALLNAQQYGKAEMGAVIGKVIAENPEAKNEIVELKKEISETVAAVNKMSKQQIEKELKKFGKIEKPKKVEEHLKPLPNAVKGKVVMRMAPNPNGPLHIGHARMIILNDEYTKKYKGKLFLRFDDTDPKNPNKRPWREAYKMIEDDLLWLGVKWHKTFRASERLEVYYKYFEKVLQKGWGYVCTCPQEEWANLVRINRGQCPCASNGNDKNLQLWEQMLAGEFKEGQAVGRMKTSRDISDPAVLDWVTFRVVDEPQHPFVKDKKVWPMLDFASAIDDYEFKITHIIRGKDLIISEVRQKILYDYFGWKYPETLVYGKLLTTDEMILSKSKIVEGIKKGLFTGFDDPRLALLMAFRRRGIQPKAIRNYIVNLGVHESETNVDLNILYDENKKIIDAKSNRYFFVGEPIQINLDRLPMKKVLAPTYPGKRTYRKIPVSKKIFVDKIDLIANREKEVRLMHFCNLILNENAKVTGKANKGGIPKIHWAPEKNLKVKLIMNNGKEIEGICEPEVEKVKVNDTIQFERIGFVRCDENSKKSRVFYFAHK